MDLFNISQSPHSPSQERARVPGPQQYRYDVIGIAQNLMRAAVSTYPVTAVTSQETSTSSNTSNVDYAHSPVTNIQNIQTVNNNTSNNTDIDATAAANTALAVATPADETLAAMGETINA